ncbi:MAG TPA: sulfatase [Planctomycetota bacterium]|nr:sulfatase [Planctomycetota bacterium]
MKPRPSPRRGELLAGLRLLLVLLALVAFALWWRRDKAPDFVLDQRLRLMPTRAVQGASAANLGGEARDALLLPCGQTLRFEFTVPGDEPVLRFVDGHVTAHPEVSVRLVEGGAARELEHHETTEQAWTVRRVPLPADAGERVTVELAALDGRGKVGLGTVLLTDVVLESAGRGVDETETLIGTRSVDQDLLASSTEPRVFAPPTRESQRIGVEGPSAVVLDDAPFWSTTAPLPADARLDLVLHVGRKFDEGPAGRAVVDVLLGDDVLGTVVAELAAPDPGMPAQDCRELAGSLDLSAFAGRTLELGLRRRDAPNLWVGVRELSVSVPRHVPRRPYKAGRGRNVLLVVVDSLRADRLGCAGWPSASTPVLDRIAARGGRWTRVLAPSSWALPNVASLLTGVSPLSHGLGVWPHVQLSARLPTLAQTAAWSGYTTALFTSDPLSGPQHGLDHGFERCDVARVSADELVDRAIDWLQDASQFEWFLMLHLADPSFPHEPAPRDVAALKGPPPPALLERLRKLDSRPGAAEAVADEIGTLYDAELTGVDRALGRVTDWLAARDLLRDTLVVVVGSSGEEFFDHGGRLHGQTLWDEVVNVPLIMSGPGLHGPDGGPFVEDEPISLLDVTRLLGEYGNLSANAGRQGRLPPPFGPRLPEPVFHSLLRPVPGATANDLDASRSRAWLRLADHVAGTEALYDLVADPGALHDVLQDKTLDDDARAALRTQAKALAASFAEWVRASLLVSACQPEAVEVARP